MKTAIEFLYEIVSSCAFSNLDKWGDVMELVYQKSQQTLTKVKATQEKS